MGFTRSNYRVAAPEIKAGQVQASHLEAAVLFTGLASQAVRFQITIEHVSDTGDVETFSMEGYGEPEWVIATPASNLTFTFITKIRTSVTTDSSLVYLTVAGASGSMGSLAATTSYPWIITALIASR